MAPEEFVRARAIGTGALYFSALGGNALRPGFTTSGSTLSWAHCSPPRTWATRSVDGEFAPAYPIVPGHEFADEIVAVGSQVTGYAVGDQVAVDPSLYCGHCYYCKRARGNQRENWGAIGVTESGGAAEFVSAPMANLFALPDHLPARRRRPSWTSTRSVWRRRNGSAAPRPSQRR